MEPRKIRGFNAAGFIDEKGFFEHGIPMGQKLIVIILTHRAIALNNQHRLIKFNRGHGKRTCNGLIIEERYVIVFSLYAQGVDKR